MTRPVTWAVVVALSIIFWVVVINWLIPDFAQDELDTLERINNAPNATTLDDAIDSLCAQPGSTDCNMQRD